MLAFLLEEEEMTTMMMKLVNQLLWLFGFVSCKIFVQLTEHTLLQLFTIHVVSNQQPICLSIYHNLVDKTNKL